MNGGPQFQWNESMSICVTCKDQNEIDYFWEQLSAVSESEACGWLKDKFGLSWQIVPIQLDEILETADSVRIEWVMEKLLGMKKLIIDELVSAWIFNLEFLLL